MTVSTPLRQQLSNGAVVTVEPSRTTPAVSIDATVRAGSLEDPAEAPGTSSLVSRVLDRGTVTRSAAAVADTLESRGVALKLTTNRHLLSLTCSCLAEDFTEILTVVSEILRSPGFPADEVDKRRAEALTAIRQDEDNPSVRAVEAVLALLYGDGHPYGRPVGGLHRTVARLGRESLLDFHRRCFVPPSLSVAIVGDVDVATASGTATRLFGDWTGAAARPDPLPDAPARRPRRQSVVTMRGKAQVEIAYGLIGVSRLDPAYYACTVMNCVLGQSGLGGRLGRSIREEQGLAYYAFSTLDATVVEGPLVIRVGVDADHVERAVASIDEEVARMAREGVRESELEDSRRFLVGSIPRQLETNADTAAFLQVAEFFDLGLDHVQRLPRLLSGVTREQVAAVARRVLSPDRAAIAMAGPYDPADAG